jgi:hypothetical protein
MGQTDLISPLPRRKKEVPGPEQWMTNIGKSQPKMEEKSKTNTACGLVNRLQPFDISRIVFFHSLAGYTASNLL